MVKDLPLSDFRAVRRVLESSDFALVDDGPEAPPSDLISEKAWHSIMELPGDVAIRTTSHQGTRINTLALLTSAWTEAFPPSPSIILHGMLDGFDAFQASLFNVVHGFYRRLSLRSAMRSKPWFSLRPVHWQTTFQRGKAGSVVMKYGLQNSADGSGTCLPSMHWIVRPRTPSRFQYSLATMAKVETRGLGTYTGVNVSSLMLVATRQTRSFGRVLARYTAPRASA